MALEALDPCRKRRSEIDEHVGGRLTATGLLVQTAAGLQLGTRQAAPVVKKVGEAVEVRVQPPFQDRLAVRPPAQPCCTARKRR